MSAQYVIRLVVAPRFEILLQGAYQGLVPSVLGISCLNIAVRHLGANTTSVYLSAVPVVAALGAIPILKEMPGLPAWIGMITVTVGILLALGIVSLFSNPYQQRFVPTTNP